MSEILVPRPEENSDPLTYGFNVNYGYRGLVGTPISGGGDGHIVDLNLELGSNFTDTTIVDFSAAFDDSEGKFPTSASGDPPIHDKHMSLRLGFGSSRRKFPLFSDNRNFIAALDSSSVQYLGVGKTWRTRGDKTVDGETFGFEGDSATTFDIGSMYSFTGEFRPWGRDFVLYPGFALELGTQYAGEGSRHNRITLAAMIMLGGGYGTFSDGNGGNADQELSGAGIAQGFYSLGHGLLSRYAMNKVLMETQAELAAAGLGAGGDGGDRGPLVHLPFLQAFSSMAGGLGSPLSPALQAGDGWYWGLGAGWLARGIASFAMGGDANYGGGMSDLLTGVRLFCYYLADIETPGNRLKYSIEDVRARQAYINIANWMLGTALMLGGALGDKGYLTGAGAGNAMQISFTPDPVERNLVGRTSYSIVPYTLDGLAGISIHHSWNFPTPEFQLYSSVTLTTPSMRFDNLARLAKENSPFAAGNKNTFLRSSLGFEWNTTWTSLSLGPEVGMIYGGSAGEKALLGLQTSFHLLLPFNGKRNGFGLSAGLTLSTDLVIPAKKLEFDVLPTIGFTF